MISFNTAYSGGRPVRLKEETRLFADESLKGKYGDETAVFISQSAGNRRA